jgi:hypothetical protein
MKKKEKLKKTSVSLGSSNPSQNLNSILLKDLELRQVSGPPRSGLVPAGQDYWVDSGFLHDHPCSDYIRMTKTIWGGAVEDECYDQDTGKWLDSW